MDLQTIEIFAASKTQSDFIKTNYKNLLMGFEHRFESSIQNLKDSDKELANLLEKSKIYTEHKFQLNQAQNLIEKDKIKYSELDEEAQNTLDDFERIMQELEVEDLEIETETEGEEIDEIYYVRTESERSETDDDEDKSPNTNTRPVLRRARTLKPDTTSIQTEV